MTREEMKDGNRNNILKSSYELFIKKGVENTSIQEIALLAGLGKGTFYTYFKDKYEVRDLLIYQKTYELFFNSYEKLLKNGDSIIYLSDRTVFVIDSFINELISQPKLLKFISKDLSYGLYKNALKEIYEGSKNSLLDLFSNGIKKNGEKIKKPKLLLNMIIELVGSTCYNSIIFLEPLPINEYKSFLLDNVKVLIENPNN